MLKCDIKGCHLTLNFSTEPLSENLIFSSLRKEIMSPNQEDANGGLDDFHESKILLRARREENAITSACLASTFGMSTGTPKMSIKGHGCRSIFRTSDKVLKMMPQNFSNFGHK